MRIKIWVRRKLKRMFSLYRRKRIIAVLVSLFLVIFVGLLYYFVISPQIHLKGDKKVILNYQEKYVEKGYVARFFGDDVTDDVVVSGHVNSEKLGTYRISYEVKEAFLRKKVVRSVSVLDTQKPVLDIDDKDLYLCPGSEIVPDKVQATDNYDGDLTSKVKTIISRDKGKLTYQVSDMSGNTSKVEKKILYEDIEKPVLSLKGEEHLYLFVGDEFSDPGVEVHDNCDQDLSQKVKVDGTVDMNQVGDYTLTYRVSDRAKNENSIVRYVKVSEKNKDGVVYLTFDDGPNEGTTNVILDILKEEGVQATFFVTSKGPDYLIKREYDEGHMVALHTSSHDYAAVYASDEAFFADLQTVHDRVFNLTGYDSKLIRFPGGSSNTVSRHYSTGIMSRLTQEVLNRGYKYYDWNVSSGDAGSTTDPNQVYLNVVNNLRRDRVNMVLMHDIKPYTRDAIRNIIRYCKENGYPMEKITESTEMVTQRVNN
mgnify:CR=1 FL=1